METFVLKIYRRDKLSDHLVGTVQNINSGQHFIFSSQQDLCALLSGQITQLETYQNTDAEPASPEGDFSA